MANFPTVNNDRSRLYDLYGDWLSIGSTRAAASYTSGNQINVAGSIVPYGFRARVTSLTITSTFGVTLQGQVQRGYFAGANPKVNAPIVGRIPNGGGSVTLQWPESVDILEGGFFDLRVTPTETGTNGTVTTWPTGALLTNDEYIDAQYMVDVWGDSIVWTNGGNLAGGSIPNFGNSHYAARITSQLRAEGIDVWRNNRGFGGATTLTLSQAVQLGLMGRPKSEWNKLKMVILGTGINDAAFGDATSQNFTANMTTILDYIYLNAPNCAVLLMGQTPTDNTTRATNLPSYRTATQALVTQYVGKQIAYVDNTNIPLIAANFSDTGPYLHPRWDTGGLIMYQNAYPVVQTFNFYKTLKKS
jgi:hypothetical protein